MSNHIPVYIYTWEPKSQFFFHRLGLTRFFCHYGFVGWNEGPFWRTQIRSVNAREVEKKLWVFIGFLSILFGFFLANCWVECAFGPTLAQSQSNWHVFSIKCYLFSVKMKQAHTACWRFFSVIAEKNMRSWKSDYKNTSLLVIRHMNEKILTFGFPGIYIYIYLYTSN